MIRLERTRDLALVRAVMTHPRVYPWLAADGAPAPADFRPNPDPGVVYLAAYEGDELLGLCLAHPVNPALWEIDLALLPNAAGPRARAIAPAWEAWLFAETPCRKAMGLIPSDNTLAIRYARRAGMRVEGILERAFVRGGKLHDLIIFTKEKGF